MSFYWPTSTLLLSLVTCKSDTSRILLSSWAFVGFPLAMLSWEYHDRKKPPERSPFERPCTGRSPAIPFCPAEYLLNADAWVSPGVEKQCSQPTELWEWMNLTIFVLFYLLSVTIKFWNIFFCSSFIYQIVFTGKLSCSRLNIWCWNMHIK